MSEQEFREIQLSGKQLFFLAMSGIVLSIVIFLLGVSVGRGVAEGESADAMSSRPTDTAVSAAPAPPADTSALGYHDALKGQTPATPQNSAPPATAPGPQSAATPVAGGGTTRNPSTGEVPPITPTITPRAAVPPPTAEPRPASPAPATGRVSSGWHVQVGAFRLKPNAEALAAELKGKGYDAYIVAGGRGQTQNVLLVGPMANRAEANKVRAALAELLKGRTTPSVISR